MQKQKNKLFIGIAILFIVFAGYFLLNKIVVQFLDKEMQLHKINFDDYDCDTHVYLYMNPFTYEDDNLFETLCCTGWAFIPAKENYADKQTFIILKGRKGSYISADCGGIYDALHERLKGWKDIPGKDNQFNARFSTVNLPDDIYDIYVYVEENEQIKGISPTNYAFKKEGINLYEYVPGCQVLNGLDVSETDGSIDHGWVNVYCEPEYVKVSGWAAMDSISPEDTEYLILFKGNNGNQVIAEATNICRTDVARNLGDTLYTESGYCCGLETAQLPDEFGKIYLIIKHGDKFYQSKAKDFSVSTAEYPERQLHKINYDDYNYNTPMFLYMNPFIYENDNSSETLRCTGWAFIPAKENYAEKQTFIILRGRKESYISAGCGGIYDNIHERLKGWKDIPGNDNQFSAEFSTADLPDDIYDIYIYIKENEQIKGISPTNYAFRKEGSTLYEYIPRSNILDDFEMPEKTSSIDNGWVTVSCEPEYVKASGWATLNSIASEDTEYLVLFEGNNGTQVIAEAIKTCRTDVAEKFNNTLYTESGYFCGLEKEQLPDNTGKVYLIIKHGDNYYKSKAKDYNITNQ